MKITDEAVAEIAGRMFDGDLVRQPWRVQERVWRDARAALEAALPHLEGATPAASKVSVAEILLAERARHRDEYGTDGLSDLPTHCSCGRWSTPPEGFDEHVADLQSAALLAAGLFRDAGPLVPDHVHCEHRETQPDEYGAMRCTYCGLVF